MGLLDNLFKPKPDTGAKKIVEGAEQAAAAELTDAAGKAEEVNGGEAKATGFHAPKTYVPRAAVQVVPPTRAHPPAERKPAAVPTEPSGPKIIVLTLGDVLPRIPAHFLQPGEHDAKRELRFQMDDLSADLARGRAAVDLKRILAQCPDVFVAEAEDDADFQVRLPLQKLVEQIEMTPMQRTAPPVDRPTFKPIPVQPASAPTPSAPAESPKAAPPADSMLDREERMKPAPIERVDPSSISAPSVATASSFAPEPSAPETNAAEDKIHLSLAAILKRCPPEIVVGALPVVDEAVRITFPFPPIERQLASGKVEVSSLRFVAALPPGLIRYFAAKEGVKVPLPLEEIFQNLPGLSAPAVISVAARPAAIPPPVAVAASVETVEAKTPEVSPAPAPESHVEPLRAEPLGTIFKSAAPKLGEDLPKQAAEPEPVAPRSSPTSRTEAASSFAAIAEQSIEESIARPSEEAPPPPPLRAFLPSLRPPILRPTEAVPMPSEPVVAEPEKPAVEPAPFAEAAPSSPPAAFQPPPEVVPEPAPVAAQLDPGPPPAIPLQPQAAEPEPAAAATEPEVSVPVLPGLIPRIGPPLIRPVVVMPPRIFITSVAASASVAPPAEEPVAESPAPVAAGAVPENGSTPTDASAPTGLAPAGAREPMKETPVAEPAPVVEEPVVAVPAPLPSLSFDGTLAALFHTAIIRDLPHLGELLAALPGMQACVLVVRELSAHGGALPAGLDPQSLRELGQQMNGALSASTGRLSAGEMQHLTLHGERFSLSLFTRGAACVGAVHRARIFLPGVREKFAAVAEELARQTS